MVKYILPALLTGLLCSAGIDASQDRQVRPTPERDLRPVERPIDRPQEEAGEVQASYDIGILNILYRGYLEACVSHSERRTTMRLRCPDGSQIEVEMLCHRQGVGGIWPNCNYQEDCEQTNDAACPPIVTQPED
jgi:hypothetical protein